MNHPDAVVIGAGVIGASVAVHLARAGLRVTVVDRGAAPGTGSTARATGGFRAQYATAINVRLSLLARPQLLRFRDDTGVDPGFRSVGYLWLATREGALAELRAANQLQRREGLGDAVLLSPADVPAINRFIALDGVLGAAWCPSDGVMRPTEILRGYLAAAERLGVALRWDEPAVAVDRDPAGRITAIATPRTRYPAAIAVNAAGAWAGSVAGLAGVDPGFQPVGYLWLATTAAALAELRAAHQLQRREGLGDAVLLAPADVPAINRLIALDGVLGAAWCPSDGVMRPTEILRGYLAAAERLGVALRWGEPAVAVDRDPAGRITAVATPRARYPAAIAVNAGGAWAGSVAQLAGVDLPVVPLRRQVAITEPTDALPADFPMTIWDDGFHLRVRDDRVLLLQPTPGDPADPWSDVVDPAWLDDIAAAAPIRVPALRGVALDRPRAWAGLYEMSPDHHAILGWAPGCPNLLLVNGSSGHGVMHAPALGLLAAEIAAHGTARSLDVHPLRPSRFAEGDPVRGSALL